MTKPDPNRTVRWWPLKWVLAILPMGVIAIWGVLGGTHSVKILATELLIVGVLGLSLLWFLFFSRLPGKTRLTGFAIFTALGISLVSLVEIREVSGDVMPILAWKWAARPDETLANDAKLAQSRTTLAITSDHDYPRFLGSQSSGGVEDIVLARNWDTQPPKERWRTSVGAGWSGFAVAGDYAVTQEQRGEMEMVTCYTLKTGELLWAHGDEARFDTTVGGVGPRATPTIVDGKVYTFGALGLLNCLDLVTGKLIWQKQTAVEHKAEKPRWGYSSSPLFVPSTDDLPALIVVSPGGFDGHSLAAYAAEKGDLIWAGGDAPPGYSSPQLVRLADTGMILIFNHGSIAAHHPKTGQVLWQVPWPGDNACVANPRVLPGDRVLVSAGYGRGAKLYHITQTDGVFNAELIYENRRFKAKFANFMIHGDYAYGLDDGILACMNTTTGERTWKKGRYGHGQLLLAGDLLLLQAEDGELHLLEAQPESHQHLGSIPVLNGKSWNTLALAGNLLLMRNHQEAVCLELPLK